MINHGTFKKNDKGNNKRPMLMHLERMRLIWRFSANPVLPRPKFGVYALFRGWMRRPDTEHLSHGIF